MSQGKRRECGKCYSRDYSVKAQLCNVCGWTPPEINQKKLGAFK